MKIKEAVKDINKMVEKLEELEAVSWTKLQKDLLNEVINSGIKLSNILCNKWDSEMGKVEYSFVQAWCNLNTKTLELLKV